MNASTHNPELSRACLASQRSARARARHANVVAAFNEAGAGKLLAGPVVRKAAIKRTFLKLAVKTAPTVTEWDAAETYAESFVRFLQREKQRGVFK